MSKYLKVKNKTNKLFCKVYPILLYFQVYFVWTQSIRFKCRILRMLGVSCRMVVWRELTSDSWPRIVAQPFLFLPLNLFYNVRGPHTRRRTPSLYIQALSIPLQVGSICHLYGLVMYTESSIQNIDSGKRFTQAVEVSLGPLEQGIPES